MRWHTIVKYIKETLDKNGIGEKCVAFTGEKCNTIFRGNMFDNEERC